jgi:imidazoleglycerol phosphate dehydratase HisB
MAKSGKHVTVAQAATMLGCSSRWVRYLLENHQLKGVQIGARQDWHIDVQCLIDCVTVRQGKLLAQVRANEQKIKRAQLALAKMRGK